METFVEGEWNGFLFKRATASMRGEIHELLFNNFYTDQPINRKFGYSLEYDEDFTSCWYHLVDNGLSFGAFEKGSNKV